MGYNAAPLEKLIEEFSKFPGIGRKGATRMAYQVLSMSDQDAAALAGAIQNAHTKLHRCRVCQNYTEAELCPICASAKRDRSVICVVETPRDVQAFERTREYHGMYHVLHGLISPMDGIGAEQLTVKELLAHVLSRRGKTACNALNLNNQVGMPLCMLKTDGDEDFWVFEAGISHEGDMDELGAILQPDLALILNVGAAHTEGLGERGVAWHKSRLLAHLAPEGQALVSADYDDLVREARAVFGDVLFFTASGRPLSYRAAYAGCSDGVHGQYRLWLDGRPCDVIAPFRGDYGTENCIAVAAAAHMLGLTAEEIAAGFADAQLPPQRFARSRRGNWDIVDDTYNANPLSMARMLDAAAESAQKRPFVVVLGEMRELGSVADREHERLGRHLAQLRPVLVFWRGGHADAVRDGLEHGLYTGKFLPVDSGEAFVQALNEHLPAETGEQGGLMLFKGSRGNHLEELLEALEQSDWLPGSRTESL